MQAALYHIYAAFESSDVSELDLTLDCFTSRIPVPLTCDSIALKICASTPQFTAIMFARLAGSFLLLQAVSFCIVCGHVREKIYR
jgi:hypothetical protein